MEPISPNEIKKYIYCPYQWYYERSYGRKEILRLYRERNERLGFSDSGKSLFVKGTKFHNSYRPYSLRRVLAGVILILIIVVICVLYVYLNAA